MLHFLLFFTLLMTLVLTLLLSKPQKRIVKQVIWTYTVLFGLSSVVITGVVIHNTTFSVKDWLLEQHMETVVSATELPAPELEPVFPLIEQIQLRPSVRLEAPIIGQFPELPRGCEVTSLAMLLQYFGVNVDKMELANKITKDETPYKKTKDGVYFGNPAKGFVGDMYSFSNPGLGVYHQPVATLARQYLGNQIHDFSGGSFYQILKHVNADRPVWVITNATYKKLSPNQFETWQTKDGPITITMREHSVLVTGYDEEYIYFNDPIRAEQRKAPIENFKEAWVQMGKQAITVITP